MLLLNDRVGLPSGFAVLQSDRVGLQSDRVGLQGDRVGLQGDCVGLQGDRVGLQSDCVGLQSDRVGLQGDCVGLQRGFVAVHGGTNQRLWQKLLPAGGPVAGRELGRTVPVPGGGFNRCFSLRLPVAVPHAATMVVNG